MREAAMPAGTGPYKAGYDAIKHHRRSIRLKGYDYTQAGAYIVTLVTWQRECLFGDIKAEEMVLNWFGELAENEWQRLGDRFPQVTMDEWIVMPNHIHSSFFAPPLQASSAQGTPIRASTELVSGSLGAIMGAYKSTTARLINGLRRTPGARVWQRNYYEHIIRNETETAPPPQQSRPI